MEIQRRGVTPEIVLEKIKEFPSSPALVKPFLSRVSDLDNCGVWGVDNTLIIGDLRGTEHSISLSDHSANLLGLCLYEADMAGVLTSLEIGVNTLPAAVILIAKKHPYFGVLEIQGYNYLESNQVMSEIYKQLLEEANRECSKLPWLRRFSSPTYALDLAIEAVEEALNGTKL